jgi:hypothetical protein
MSITLKVYLTGLCAFVPKLPIQKHPNGNQMRVLMVDVRQPGETDEEPYLPVLICRSKDVDRSDGNRTEDDTFTYKGKTQGMFVNGETYALFFLADQDLQVDGARRDSLAIQFASGGLGCPTPQNVRDFAWVAALESIDPTSSSVKDACLNSTNVDKSVAARFALTDGEIETCDIARNGNQEVTLCDFTPVPVSPVPRAIADSALFSQKIHNESSGVCTFLTHLFRPIGETEEKVRKLYSADPVGELRIVVRSNETEINVAVENMPRKDIERQRQIDSNQDNGFIHFYSLLQQPGSRSIPKKTEPCAVQELGTLFHQGNPNCPPVLTAANSEA